jgi:mannose/fructose/N-acetylgalactosamine-specific phosphotransferase system component IIC
LGSLEDRLANTTGFNLSGIFSVLGALCLISGLALGFFLAFIMFNKLKKQGQKSNNNNAAAAQRQRFEDEEDEE